MNRWTSRLLTICALLFITWCGIFAVSMLSQLADAADRLHAGAGQYVFGGLLVLLLVSVLLPTIWLLRLPAALRYPAADDADAVAAYQQRLRAHLARHPQWQGQPLHTDADVAQALAQLQAQAQAQTQRTAANVFASTALLQNGRLDGLVVLVSQIQLVWRIAQLYGLRPSLRQISYLYSHVGACVLIANSLDDVDFTELTAPIVQSVTPAAISAIPGLGGMGQLLTNSLASGAANAFLTLRVGLIAAAYCAPQQAPQRQSLRQKATTQAAQLLAGIVKDCGSQVTQAVYGRIKSGILHTAQTAADSVKQAATQVRQSSTSATQRLQQALLPKSKNEDSKGQP